MKTKRILYAAALLLAACQTENAQGEQAAATTKQSAGPVVGKPQAPVQIDADVGASSGRRELQRRMRMHDRRGERTRIARRANDRDPRHPASAVTKVL